MSARKRHPKPHPTRQRRWRSLSDDGSTLRLAALTTDDSVEQVTALQRR